MYGDPTLREGAPTVPSHPRTPPPPRRPILLPCVVSQPSSLGSSWGWGDTGRPGAEGDTLDFQASETLPFPPLASPSVGRFSPLPYRSARASLCSQVVAESPSLS